MQIAKPTAFTVVYFGVIAVSSIVQAQPLSLTIKDGHLFPSGQYVGYFTSQIQSNVVDKLYPVVNPAEKLSNVSVVNVSVLRYLSLEGDYLADQPLLLPSLFVLRLSGSIKDAVNLTNNHFNGVKHVGLITLNETLYSGVIGGVVNATSHDKTEMQAISILNGYRNTIRKVRVLSNWESSIGINGGSQNEIDACDAGGDEGRLITGRAIWLLSTTKGYIHHCHVHHSLTHALDFDAFTSSSVAWENVCEDNAHEGIFVEETAHENVIVGNTCRRNMNGIGVYSKVVGPVKGNIIFGNLVQGNTNAAISAGGFNDSPNKRSESNTFFGNIAKDIPAGLAAFNPMHGHQATLGDFWFGNTVQPGAEEFSPIPICQKEVAIFEP